jgi:hypothetical protein
MRIRRPALAVLCALIACGLGACGSAGAAVPGTFFGVEAKDVYAGDAAYRQRELRAQEASGVGLIRQVFFWSEVERNPGRFTFESYDSFVAETARHGIDLLPILFGPPSFRSSKPDRGARHGTYPPKSDEDFAAFAAAVVRRYGPSGSFWADHPDLPAHPIRNWQIWNEPHLPAFWPTGPDPAAYVKMLRTVGTAIKDVDPDANIVAAGLSQSALPGAIPLSRFITAMYRAGGASAFDTLAVHPYARTPGTAVDLVKRTRALMDRLGDRDGRLWVTEISWSANGPRSKFTTSAGGQARNLRTFYSQMLALRARLRLVGVVYFQWRDPVIKPPLKDFWGWHTALIRPDGKRKPAFYAYRRVALAARG